MSVETKRLPGGVPYSMKVVALSLVPGGAVSALSAALDRGFAAGFAVGYFLGVLNILWLFRITRRGISMDPDRAFRYVAVNYYLRFLLTVLILVALIVRGVLLKPWPPVVGISLSIFASVALLAIFAREEVSSCTRA